jgi:hypothetical protein
MLHLAIHLVLTFQVLDWTTLKEKFDDGMAKSVRGGIEIASDFHKAKQGQN